VKQGNDRKMYIAGHSVGGPSVLANQVALFDDAHDDDLSSMTTTSTNSSTSSFENNTTMTTPESVVYGMVLDMTWYGEVQGGYLMDDVAVQYPVAVTSTVPDDSAGDSSSNSDVWVASLRSTATTMKPVYRLVHPQDDDDDQQQQQQQLDWTTAGTYFPPAYGSLYSLHVQRLEPRP
jgi:hypothetical protein